MKQSKVRATIEIAYEYNERGRAASYGQDYIELVAKSLVVNGGATTIEDGVSLISVKDVDTEDWWIAPQNK